MTHTRSVYNAGANDGLLMGIYLSVMFVLQAIGLRQLTLMVLGDLMMLAIPVVAYVMLRREYVASQCRWTFSAVWLHGIVAFLCGSLILALVMYGYMRFVEPTFIYDQFSKFIDAYREAGTAQTTEMADVLQRMIDRKLLPTPISMAVSVTWLVSFLGAMLSMAIACILKFLLKKKV